MCHWGWITNLYQRIWVYFPSSKAKTFNRSMYFPFLPSPTLCIISQLPLKSVVLPIYLEAGTSEFRSLPSRPRPSGSPHFNDRETEDQRATWFAVLLKFVCPLRNIAFSRVGAGEETLRNEFQLPSITVCLLAGLPKPFVLILPSCKMRVLDYLSSRLPSNSLFLWLPPLEVGKSPWAKINGQNLSEVHNIAVCTPHVTGLKHIRIWETDWIAICSF